jgi:hypothetical protein
VHSPGGGELLLGLPGAASTVTVGGSAAAFGHRHRLVHVAVPAGPQELRVTWRR